MLPYFQIATRPLAPELQRTVLPGRQGAWDTKSILSSFRLDARGRLIFGSVGALRGPGHTIHSDWVRRELRSEEHTSELQSLMRISYAVLCLKQKIIVNQYHRQHHSALLCLHRFSSTL